MNKSNHLGIKTKNRIHKNKNNLKEMILNRKTHQSTKNQKRKALPVRRVNTIKNTKSTLNKFKKKILLNLQTQT